MKESFLQKLRMVRLRDLGHIFLFLFALLPAALYRKRRPSLWLVCEGATEARDNGYWFFRYLREKQPQVDAVYAIKKDCEEYKKAACLGPVVEYGSFRHWIFYLAAEVNISSQKSGKPNAAVCYLLEVVLGLLKNKRVFLQHGVINNDLPYLHWDKTGMCMFSCSALPEYEFVRDAFGYPPGVVQHVGLCRFDALHGNVPDKALVLIVPTWRMWLQRCGGEAGKRTFLESAYYRCWNGLLHSVAFAQLLARCHKRAVFCVHRNMHAYEDCFSAPAENIAVLRWQEADIPELLREAGVLVTDFSSVAMDFAYMKKPLAYYQFDRAEFREGHLPAGYFDYDRDGFGAVCETEDELLAALETIFANDCRMGGEYSDRLDGFFMLNDDKNCERTYEAVQELLQGA